MQIAMELYKEQRYEMKGLPDVKYEGSQVSPPHTKIDVEMDDRLFEIGDVSELDAPQKMEQEAALPELEKEREVEEERGSSPNPTEAREDAAMSEDEEEGVVVIVGDDDVSSKVLVSESDESVITRIHHGHIF